jgi:hypothetical protein
LRRTRYLWEKSAPKTLEEVLMTPSRLSDRLAQAALILSIACGRPGGPAAASAPAARTASPPAEPTPAPYTYPAPVKGHLDDVNTGSFDLVDGIAYPSRSGAGTVVYVTSKPIASPALAGSPCPMTQARALTSIRNAGWVEVTLDPKGKSKFYTRGTAFGGTGREEEVGGRSWLSRLDLAGGRAKGTVRHKEHGDFEFDLAVSSPTVREVSESDRMDGVRGDPGAAAPSETRLTAAYEALRSAAAKKDLKALLAAEGYDEAQVAAIRGLEGIGADFAVYADRFLSPGTPTPDEFQSHPGYGAIRSEGVNSKGAKFVNYFWFTPCGEKLVLVAITENPQ